VGDGRQVGRGAASASSNYFHPFPNAQTESYRLTVVSLHLSQVDLPIQSKLALAVFVIWLVLMPVTVGVTHHAMYVRLLRAEERSLDDGRRMVASLIEARRASVEEEMRLLAKSRILQQRLFSTLYLGRAGEGPSGKQGEGSEILATLEGFQTGRLPKHVLVTDLLGHVFARLDRGEPADDTSVLDPAHLLGAPPSQWFRYDGLPSLLVVVPVDNPGDTGEAIGYIAAIEPLNDEFLQWLHLNTGFEHAVADYQGRLEEATSAELPPEVPVGNEPRVGQVVEAGGYLFSVHADPELDFLLLSAAPVDLVTASARGAARSTVVATSLVGFLPILFIIAGGQRLLRPLSRLTRRMASYAGPGAPVAQRDQVMMLEKAFAAMVDAISQRETRLREAAERLEAANVELTSLDRLKTELLANVSHELRTPLVSIRGYAEMVRDGKAGPVTEKQKQFLDVILRNSLNQARLIDELLELTTLGEGHRALRLEVRDLRPVLSQAVDDCRPEIKKKGLQLDAHAGDVPLRAAIDARRLVQLFANLLSNAVKFTEPGGAVAVRAERSGDEILVHVTDTGIGIPENQLEQIFTRFHQVETGMARSYGGTGLGLAIARRIAELHGGTLTATSRTGEGSTFTLRLPAVAA
jgi:signal transduction histidine kinase